MITTLYKNAAAKYDQILKVVFLIVFLIQFGFLFSGYIHPSQLNSVTKIVKKGQLEEFPLMFQFCLRPGFNITLLKRNGYTNMDNYFWGTNRTDDKYNSDVGWGGGSSLLTPEGLTSIIYSRLLIYLSRITESELFGKTSLKIHTFDL